MKNGDRLKSLKLNLISLLADRVVAVSNGLREHLISKIRFGRKKFITIYNGIDLNVEFENSQHESKRAYGFSDSDLLIGAIGNLKPAKGYEILIKVAKIVSDKYTECQFVIAGRLESQSYSELQKLINELGLEMRVHFLGFQDNVNNYLKMLDIFILTSHSEGFSLAVIEAMRAGVPVVATRSGGPQEILSHNINGLLADVGDYRALANGILSLIENNKLKQKLVVQAKKNLNSKYCISYMTENYKKTYCEILKN